MSAKRAAEPAPQPSVQLVPSTFDDGVLVAVWRRRRLRFLLGDGSVLDVIAERDDSDLRGAVLRHTGAERIAGVAELPDEPLKG